MAVNTLVDLDVDALYRQQDLAAKVDFNQMTVNEKIAASMDIKYIEMAGNIGIVSNSAGLCMAT